MALSNPLVDHFQLHLDGREPGELVLQIAPRLIPLSTPADGGELPPHLGQRNSHLHFAKVTRSDAGNYTCSASNSLQGEIRAVVSLTVAGKPLTTYRFLVSSVPQPNC